MHTADPNLAAQMPLPRYLLRTASRVTGGTNTLNDVVPPALVGGRFIVAAAAKTATAADLASRALIFLQQIRHSRQAQQHTLGRINKSDSSSANGGRQIDGFDRPMQGLTCMSI